MTPHFTAPRLTVGKALLATVIVFGLGSALSTNDPEALKGFFILGALALGYFLPWIFAHSRGHHQTTAIGMLTLLLGWTALGWVVAMVWACTAVRQA